MAFSVRKNKTLPSVGDTDTSDKHLTCAEYFAGIGLVRLGLEQVGWKVVFANDWAYDKFEMYSAYFKDASKHYRVQDIFSVCHSDIPNTLLATASFPCIDLSLAGNLKGIHGQYSSAFWGFTQILDSQGNKPPLVMLENVTGWLTSNGGQDFRITIEELNRLGYACDVYAINAAHFVPQSRPRIFVIGVHTSDVNQNMLIFARRSSSLKTQALEKAIAANHDLRWNFIEVPPLPEKVKTGLSGVVENISDHDERWWLEDKVQRHLTMMSPVNLDYLKEFQDLSYYSYCTMYRRVREGKQRAELRKDSIAGCLRTARGGSSRQMLVRVGKGTIRMRLMTPREYARLQGVPDDYPIPSHINQALSGFGDAVCVPVITWIASHILNPLVKLIPENTLALHR
ncbi:MULTISPECIES: DNA (cytosine-5-)-methyltransferase [unclassified Moorena]|uniref:DNA cytosine methyltransferase n=1 Tax=unclassified Moorena TaxID=2683338 RepID=UPI0013CABB0F|nr:MULTISPECIES: DNA (cytosine-5-)-methyltransferase [unclassified Moorena]NEO21548.1 DNA (cytosine-5-)-methyltransferase [Moorena sp. SIO4A5]NEP21737.1 DNA (cytosine-5-)-methyltransferase [Moorena sp. SIO3I6]NEQ58835.1 DNA (cytosine-5-)-methyltransferase [Moorena sp. SIO4A1]